MLIVVGQNAEVRDKAFVMDSLVLNRQLNGAMRFMGMAAIGITACRGMFPDFGKVISDFVGFQIQNPPFLDSRAIDNRGSCSRFVEGGGGGGVGSFAAGFRNGPVAAPILERAR